MHLIFIRQYIKQIMEWGVDFVVGVLGVFLDSAPEPSCFSMFFNTFLPRRLDFSRNRLYLMDFPTLLGVSIILTISALGQRLRQKRESLTST